MWYSIHNLKTSQFILEKLSCLSVSGSLGFPTWIINGLEYAYSAALPPNHHIDLTGSVVVTDISMRGNYYQCVIDSFYSKIGYLEVLPSHSWTKHSQLWFLINVRTKTSSSCHVKWCRSGLYSNSNSLNSVDFSSLSQSMLSLAHMLDKSTGIYHS